MTVKGIIGTLYVCKHDAFVLFYFIILNTSTTDIKGHNRYTVCL